MRISYFTSSAQNCGIKDYSGNLCPEIERFSEVNYLSAAWPNTIAYYRHLGRLANNADLLQIEYETALFTVAGDRRRSGLPAFLSQVEVPIVATFHGGLYSALPPEPLTRSPLQRMRRWAGSRIERRMLMPLFERSSFILVFSAGHRDMLLSLGVPEEKICFSFHPIPAISQDAPAAVRMRAEHDLAGKFVLVLAGFIHPQKGYEIVFEILPELPEEAVVVIAGDSCGTEDSHQIYKAALRKLAASRGIGSRVQWLGPLEEPSFLAMLAAGDLVLLPYLSGSGSNVLTTAIAMRKDVICSNLSSFLDLQARYPCFNVFERGRPEDLAAQIIRVMERSKKERAPFIYRETSIHSDLSFERHALRHLELYQSALRGREQTIACSKRSGIAAE